MKEECVSAPEQVIVKKSRSTAILAFFLGLTFFMVVGFSCFYYFVVKPMKDSAVKPVERLASAMSDIFGKKMKVSGSSVVLEKSEIGELALVQRKTHAITKYQTIWMGSEKTLIVRCDFLVKAGFDLSDGGNWGILNGRFTGKLPEGEILSVEPLGDFEIYFSESGTLNKLNSEDHAKAFNLLKAQARRDAEESDAAEEAAQLLIRRITDKVGNNYLKEEIIP